MPSLSTRFISSAFMRTAIAHIPSGRETLFDVLDWRSPKDATTLRLASQFPSD